MAYNLKYNTGMIENPISFRDTNGLNVENIVSLMSQKAEELGVPARITTSTVKVTPRSLVLLLYNIFYYFSNNIINVCYDFTKFYFIIEKFFYFWVLS